jgi:hypothetical protein
MFTPPGNGVYVAVGIDNFTSEEVALNASGNHIPSDLSPSMRCLEADSKHYYLSGYSAIRLYRNSKLWMTWTTCLTEYGPS